MEEFKKTVIYPNIIECEIKNKMFFKKIILFSLFINLDSRIG